jgi:hypothetical protein
MVGKGQMNPAPARSPRTLIAFVLVAIICGIALAAVPARAGGVTLITHGLNGNTDGWITGMATNLPNYYRFQGTNFTCYKMYFYPSNSAYYLTAELRGGGGASAHP